jgi:hypothetical protein
VSAATLTAPPALYIRASWWRRTRETAPLVPAWFSHTLARILAAGATSADALLNLADALDESSHMVALNGEEMLAGQLRKLADLPRELAPIRSRLEG